MNLKRILNVVGRLLQIESLALVLPMLVAIVYQESIFPFLVSIVITMVVGFALAALPSKKHFYARDGFVAVGLIWLITGLVGALPFWLSGYFNSFIDCFFESCSGFTTTGASILTDIESLPKGILFWRSLTHWLGGMGVLVLATAILPGMGIRTHYLTQAESPGPIFSKLVPKQSQSSKILYLMYCTLTFAQVICLKIAGMPLYDCFIHAFGTAGTGGFSNRNASVGAYDSLVIDLIISVFMLLFSINFGVFFLMLTRRFREALGSDELRFFLVVVALATALIGINIYPQYNDAVETFRYAFFHVASIISTTGFATTDWLYWPYFSQFILILLMFIGACAGSTGGGMKCSRILILFRCIRREIHSIIHPNSVEVVTLDGKVVKEDTVHSVLLFVGGYLIFILGAAWIISLDDVSFAVSFSSALTSVSNVGPGLEAVGPASNFAALSPLSKMVMSISMIVGRLEIFPILVLFSPSTWRRA